MTDNTVTLSLQARIWRIEDYALTVILADDLAEAGDADPWARCDNLRRALRHLAEGARDIRHRYNAAHGL